MRPFVVDANVMNFFQQERIADAKGPAGQAIDLIADVSCIALDVDGHCQQEWLDCAAGRFPLALQDWISDMLVAQKIQLYELCANTMHKELNACGLPKADHKWVRLALGSSSYAVVTEDIDLFDPRLKNAPSKVKEKVKQCQTGPFAKYLKKNYGLAVLACHGVPGFVAGLEDS